MRSDRIPPIQCLLTFEALARLRSGTQAADELCVTPSAVSHRIRQLEQILGVSLFARSDFSLTPEGSEYLLHVREGLMRLSKFPSQTPSHGKRKITLAVTPTFARAVLMPRLRQFLDAYPEINLSLQISIPQLDAVNEGTDLSIRFGTGRYNDCESACILKDVISPVASPSYIREFGPFDTPADLQRATLLRSPLEPWRTWFAANHLDWTEPDEGSSFNDIGLMCDAASLGLGVALTRLRLSQPWLDSGQVERLFDLTVPSPHAHYLCWNSGTMERWECAAFLEWLKKGTVGL